MRPYELIWILNTAAAANDEEVNAFIERYGRLIVDNGGKVTNVEKWGRKRLAYEINDQLDGYYIFVAFSAPSDIGKELERLTKLDDRVIRHLLVRSEEVTAQPAPAQEEA